MIKIYDKFYVMRGDSYVARHAFATHVYVWSPNRERAVVFADFDAALTFIKEWFGVNDAYKIVPVEN